MKGKLMNLFLEHAPDWIVYLALPLLKTIIPSETIYETQLLNRFARYCATHYDSVIEKVKKKHRTMTIEHGRFDYSFFNVCFLNNVIGLMVYALYQGYIPIVKIRSKETGENIWDWYFSQPFETSETYENVVCNRITTDFRPNIRTGFGNNDEEFAVWSFFYKKFVQLNDETRDYVDEELKLLNLTDNSLGMIIRGTDYTGSRPKGHPVQPSVDELIAKASEFNSRYQYQTIYVATEEKRLFDAVCQVFGKDTVKQNKRKYYDEQYYDRKYSFIGQVKFDRENDAFYKGLEYLSSLIILSRCTDLVAGNCGGTEFAVLYSNNYRNKYIFNKGLY